MPYYELCEKISPPLWLDGDDNRIHGRLYGDLMHNGTPGNFTVSPAFKEACQGLDGARFTPRRILNKRGAHDWFQLHVDTVVDYDHLAFATSEDLRPVPELVGDIWRVEGYSPVPPGWSGPDFFMNSLLGIVFLSERAAKAISHLKGFYVQDTAHHGSLIYADLDKRQRALLEAIRARHRPPATNLSADGPSS